MGEGDNGDNKDNAIERPRLENFLDDNDYPEIKIIISPMMQL